MAAADEESENKNDDPLNKIKEKYDSIMHQELANKLIKPGTSYEDKVGIVLSGWDQLAGTRSNGQLSFAKFLRRGTLQLVLQGEWPKLEKIVKTRLGATLQRCAKDILLQPLCSILLPLVSDPWGHPTLKAIFASSFVSDEEAEKYVKEETWEVVRVRVDTLVESKCEKLALSFLKVCMRCLKMNTRSDDFLYSQEDHNHFVDLYFVLLYKFQRQQFFDEIRKLDVAEGVEHVRRLLTRQGISKIWKHRLKIAELEIQIFLASCIVKPLDDTFRNVFNVWCEVMEAVNIAYDELCGMMNKYIQLSESSNHIYMMGSFLHTKFGASHNTLVIELLIKALTLDMNSLEVVKLRSKEKEKGEEETKLEHQMANGFMALSDVFKDHPRVSRECLLTSFSIHPTVERLQKLNEFVIIKEEITEEVSPNAQSLNGDSSSLAHSMGQERPMSENNNEVKKDLNESSVSPAKESSYLNGSFDSHILPYDSLMKQCGENIKEESQEYMEAFLTSVDELIEQLSENKQKKDILTVKKEMKCDILTDPLEILESEKLGLSKELCDDLAVVLSSPRWQVLSWALGKEDLMSICEKYLNNTSSAKNVTSELKFLNIDYSQFEHMPKAEVDEYTGIEKGYEQFMDEESEDDSNDMYYRNNHHYYESSGSDIETPKKRACSNRGRRGKRGRPPGRRNVITSDSDSTHRSRNRSRTVTSLSESEDSDYEPSSYISGISGNSKYFEGKRVTAVSCNDRRKRLRIDVTTGKVKRKIPVTRMLRLFRYKEKKVKPAPPASPPATTQFAPRLGTLDINPTVVLTNYNQTPAKDQVPKFLSINSDSNNPKLNTSKETKSPCSPQKSTTTQGWKYAGYLVSDHSKSTPKPSAVPVKPANSSTKSCLYRTKDGKLITLNTRPLCTDTQQQRVICPSSKFEESFAKFACGNNSKSIIERKPTKDKLQITIINKNLDHLPKHGTSISLKNNSSSSILASTQKNVLNRIQNLSANSAGMRLSNLFQTIAMPVSHNPPNMPPNDKSSPVGLSRVLPKGTTVVRKAKSDNSGAGTSGLNNGGSSSTSSVSGVIGRPQTRPTISITPSNTYLISSVSQFPNQANARSTLVRTIIEPSSSSSNENPSPLAVATVVGSVSQTTSPRHNSPGETQVSAVRLLNNQATSCTTTTTTVASQPGETRAPSMLETLLRDRANPLIAHMSASGGNAALTTTTSSIQEPLVAVSSVNTGISFAPSYSEIRVPSTSQSLNNNSSSTSESPPTSSLIDSNSLRASLISGSSGLGISIVGSSLASNVLTTSLSAGNVLVSSQASLNTSVSGVTISNSTDTSTATGLPQVLVPAQLIQVQGNGSGLSIVHPGLDLRLPPGTRVLKSTANMRPSLPSNQPNSRPLNVLHKIVPNRHILRTVVVPHSMPLQNIGHQPGTTQLLALSQGSSGNNGVQTQVASKIQSSQLQKMLGHNVVPGGLLIRTVRPSTVTDGEAATTIPKIPNPTTIIHHTADAQHQKNDKIKDAEKPKIISVLQAPAAEEGLAERLNRHYLKALLASTSMQSVGTQTQTTAVKPVTGQFVSQMMNQLRGINSVATTVAVTSSIPSPSPLNLGSSNAVSSETLEQLREFESVFEKVSNKSTSKESETIQSQSPFPNSNVSSEESMIAAQLLSMANETPSVTTSSSFVYSVTSAENQITTTSLSTSTPTATTGGVVGGSTFITIPCTSQPGTLILVNPSVSASGIVTMATTSGVPASQPPPAASPALSSTSSHSSVASSPSSTSSKSKNKKPKVAIPVPPKSPPPPKAPPKPAVAKPQVEESDETKARIQAILEQYRQDLANTPQPQPAPRNRKNCPPPKNEGKSSSKKKGGVKKTDGSSSLSPGASDHMPSVSSSPAPSAVTPSGGEDSEGSLGGTSSQFHVQEENTKSEEPSTTPILQGVMVSNMKMENSAGLAGLTALSQGRLVQLIRHGNKVTAITSRQPYTKTGLASGGPPPNVTIQGRININDLLESQLTLLTGGSTTLNQNNSSLISKLLQSQQSSSSMQQVVVQTSSVGQGQSVQVALQPVITKPILKTVDPRASPPPSPALNPQSNFANTEDDSNSSHEGAPAGPLPPFFTLTKQFLVPSSQHKFREKTLNDAASPEIRSSADDGSPASSSQSQFFNLRKNLLLSSPSSPLVTHTDMSSEPSSLESSPSQRHPTLNAASQIRSNSLDSIKSDLSAEEVPPSPATLTKQLQNAYMTEAALSPAVSQSQMSSSSSYSSPSNIADLHFSEAPSDHLSPHLGPPGTSRNDAASLACLSSPSGDVYLDQAGLGLDSLVEGGRPQSPCLSDLVPPVPLLSWSPRSADSIMAQSPSLNEALSGNMTLHHSEDSMCDSSTGFAGLFSNMDNDAGSVSSSDELQQTSLGHHPVSRSQSNGTREQDQTVTSTRAEAALIVKKEESPDSPQQWDSEDIPQDLDETKMFKVDYSNPRRRSQRQTSRHSTSSLTHNGCDDKIKEESMSCNTKFKKLSPDVKTDCSGVGRQTRGSKRRSDGHGGPQEEKRRSRRSDVDPDDDDEEDSTMRVARARHLSGTSDSSSNYSVDRGLTPGPVDSPSRPRKRQNSRDSSVSSRDGSPLIPPQQEGGPRRSSSRDHAKKARCRCCVDAQQGRRRASRGSGPSTS